MNLVDVHRHSTQSVLTRCCLLQAGDAGVACRTVKDHVKLEQRQKLVSFSISNPSVSTSQWHEEVKSCKACLLEHPQGGSLPWFLKGPGAEEQPDHSAAPTGCLSFPCKAITDCLKYNQSPSSLLSGQSFLMLLQEFSHHICKVHPAASGFNTLKFFCLQIVVQTGSRRI